MLKQGDLIDTDELRALHAVAHRRSFTLAAGDVGVSQSTISQRIARLERRLNRTLVHRTTRQVSLTRDGEVILNYARSILALSDEARLLLSEQGSGEIGEDVQSYLVTVGDECPD